MSRLVLDQKHKGLVLLEGNAKSNHLATVERHYRRFLEQKIGEIRFVAILQSENVRRYSKELIDLPHLTSAYRARIHLIEDLMGWDSRHAYNRRWGPWTSKERSGS